MAQFAETWVVIKVGRAAPQDSVDGHSRMRRFGVAWWAGVVRGTRQEWLRGTPVDPKFGRQRW